MKVSDVLGLVSEERVVVKIELDGDHGIEKVIYDGAAWTGMVEDGEIPKDVLNHDVYGICIKEEKAPYLMIFASATDEEIEEYYQGK